MLRPYQLLAIDAIYRDFHKKKGSNPCVVIPTGGGKTHIIAKLCQDVTQKWNGRVAVVAHQAELLSQCRDTLFNYVPMDSIGVYSASLKKKELDRPVILAGIQSIYRNEESTIGFDMIIVDEAHLIPVEGDGMYRTFLSRMKTANPKTVLVGFTATPYRMKSGLVCGPENLLNHVCYEVLIPDLIRDGYLCNITSQKCMNYIDTSEVAISNGEFAASEMEAAALRNGAMVESVNEMLMHASDRKSVLIFASGQNHAREIVGYLESQGHSAEFIWNETPDDERRRMIDAFRRRDLRFLVNLNLLTTGFDAANVDCVALMRATLSPGLYYQMVGRGFRIDKEKNDCLILDYGHNIARHGPIDKIEVSEKRTAGRSGEAPAKECPVCGATVAAGYALCPECWYEFPRNEDKVQEKSSDLPVISTDKSDWIEVIDVYYGKHIRKGEKESGEKYTPTFRVQYILANNKTVSEFVCFDHNGFAKQKAISWWKRASHGSRVPESVDEAVSRQDELPSPLSIKIARKPGEKYPKIVGYEFGDPEPEHEGVAVSEDVPF